MGQARLESVTPSSLRAVYLREEDLNMTESFVAEVSVADAVAAASLDSPHLQQYSYCSSCEASERYLCTYLEVSE